MRCSPFRIEKRLAKLEPFSNFTHRQITAQGEAVNGRLYGMVVRAREVGSRNCDHAGDRPQMGHLGA
jgi:hypothetical protein